MILNFDLGTQNFGEGVSSLYMDQFLGAPSLLLVGGGKSSIVNDSVQWESGNGVFIVQYFNGSMVPKSRKLEDFPKDVYRPMMQQLNGKLILVDGGFVRISPIQFAKPWSEL